MTKAGCTSETSVNFYQTTRRNIPEDSHLLIIRLFSLTSHFNWDKGEELHKNTRVKRDVIKQSHKDTGKMLRTFDNGYEVLLLVLLITSFSFRIFSSSLHVTENETLYIEIN
jgi:hypothetical protein